MKEDFYRREALEHHRSGDTVGAEPLHLSPAWTRRTYLLLLALTLAGLSYLAFGSVSEYVSGPAVVTARGRTDVTAPVSARVDAVFVEPGQRAEPGDELVRFDASRELAELTQARTEYESALTSRLREPGATADRALASLRTRMELASERLEARTVRATVSGVVSDVRARPGQHLEVGQTALTLMRGGEAFDIVAMLPGSSRPHLEPGQDLRFELTGFHRVYRNLKVTSVAEEVIGPSEARRYLGAEIADAVPIAGPIVLVTAALPDDTFETDDDTYRYHDGMHGTAEARIRSGSILLSLVPGLRGVIGSSR